MPDTHLALLEFFQKAVATLNQALRSELGVPSLKEGCLPGKTLVTQWSANLPATVSCLSVTDYLLSKGFKLKAPGSAARPAYLVKRLVSGQDVYTLHVTVGVSEPNSKQNRIVCEGSFSNRGYIEYV